MDNESLAVLEAVRGCTVQEAVSRLSTHGWTVVNAVRLTGETFMVTASNSMRQMRLYGKYNRVCTANFSRRAE